MTDNAAARNLDNDIVHLLSYKVPEWRLSDI